jgi:hypothetical protein
MSRKTFRALLQVRYAVMSRASAFKSAKLDRLVVGSILKQNWSF